MEFSRLINFLLLMSEFAFPTRKTGNEVIIFCCWCHFLYQKTTFLKFLNISFRVKWRAPLVPTWTKHCLVSSLAKAQQRASCDLWKPWRGSHVDHFWGHPLSTYGKFSKKLTFLTPWYAYFTHILNGWTLSSRHFIFSLAW